MAGRSQSCKAGQRGRVAGSRWNKEGTERIRRGWSLEGTWGGMKQTTPERQARADSRRSLNEAPRRAVSDRENALAPLQMAGCRGATEEAGDPLGGSAACGARQLFSFQTQKCHGRVSEVVQCGSLLAAQGAAQCSGGEDGAGGLLRNLSILGFHARSGGAQWALGRASGAFSEGAGFGKGGAGGTQAPSPHSHHVRDFTATACTAGFCIRFYLEERILLVRLRTSNP